MWQGIVVDGSLISSASSLKFDFANCSIEDAYIGLTLDESTWGLGKMFYSIFNNIFRNNYIGVTNLRQTGANLNAVFVRNQFFQTANLATRLGPLANLGLPDYPLAHAGIKFVKANTVVGVDQHGNQNTFSCLVNGIVTEGCQWESINNFFFNLAENGIWSTGGRNRTDHCRFYGEGRVGIRTEAARFRAERNTFSGLWEEGIHSGGNVNGQEIAILNGNSFDLTGHSWRIGIYVERPQSQFGVLDLIDANTFITNSIAAPSGIVCIWVHDFVDANSEMAISNNTININAFQTIGGVVNTGMIIRLGNSDRYNVHDNHISFSMPCYGGVGIGVSSLGGQNLSMGHSVRHNDITGISNSSDIFTNPLSKCISSFRVQGVDYCDNTVDLSSAGFLFTGPNDISLRNNHINHHDIGLEISGVAGRIGKQEGRGNEWNTDPNACVQFAAVVYNSNPFLSEFVVPEGNVLPWLPPNAKLDPDPSMINWFHGGSAPLDYCVPMFISLPLQLTPYEKEVVLGTSGLSGVALWDLKREVYAKLLIFPTLRPTGSPEAAFFNSLNNTTLASLSNVMQQIRSGLALTTAYQQAYNTYSTAIDLAFSNLAVFDGNMNYSSVLNLTDTWFAQRDSLLQPIAVNAAAQATLVNTRNQQLGTALQTALTYNTAVSTIQVYESARKTIHELRIRRLLGQPITQALYQQALTLAQQGEGIVGKAANDAIDYLAYCDQKLFQSLGERHGQSEARDNYSSVPPAQLQVAPNPTTGWIEVSLPQHNGTWLTVYNLNGQKVKNLSIASGTPKVSLDLGQNPAGLYWMVLSDAVGKVICSTKVSVSH